VSGRVVAIVQARMGSSRLPGKVLHDLEGKTMIERVVDRVRKGRKVDALVVATTVEPEDDALVALGERAGFATFRGNRDDVLDRFYRASTAHEAGVVVRVTSDCPLLEPTIVDRVIDRLLEGHDYAANTIEPRTYPRGLDVEAMTFTALETAWNEDDQPGWREHVTPFLYRHPERFRLGAVRNDSDLSEHRWTVDTPGDLELVRRLYRAVGPTAPWQDVLAAAVAHPEWRALNAGVLQKPVIG
jgi:spore coat polysaccharide biosynthesis protein SpsF